MAILFITIYILTIADAACTALGVSKGVISEGNALMQSVMSAHPILTAIAVCLIIGAALYGIWRVRNRIKWLGYAMSAVLIVKLGIMGMHAFWIVQATALHLW